MPKLKAWICRSLICSSLLVVVSVAPVLAGTKDATDSKAPSETTANPAAQPAAAANANVTPASANVTALLGVLVMKGVLAPGEANAIRTAAPEAEFQLLVEALARKGVVNAADLSSAPAPSSVAPSAGAPISAKVGTATAQGSILQERTPGATVVPAGGPMRLRSIDPPV